MPRRITTLTILLLVTTAARGADRWPDAMERDFQKRVGHVLAAQAEKSQGKYGNTFFENEKRSYPAAMFDLVRGNREPAVAFLQQEDNLAGDNAHTLGIDLYPAFTLKGQVRKYFHFGRDLDPAYRERMKKAARIWTEKDPHGRPHPQFGRGSGGPGWRPQDRGGWVDVRSTDNLKAMRETSVYLFAEETGNEATRLIYKERIANYVATLYHVGMSEWDSENYLGHTIAPYLNLYDFAKDPEVKALARAALDWLTAAGAVKYYRGGIGGPTKRDYGGANVVFGSGASRTLWPWFGDTPISDPEGEPDLIHVITSTYRPPPAVVALARKEFDRPVTLQNTKPAYATFEPDAIDEPMYWETVYFGRTFALGSVMAKEPQGDVGAFKLTADNSKRGVDYLVANTAAPGEKVESCPPGKNPGDQIAQHKQLAVWLRKDARGGTQFVFQLPKTAAVETAGDARLVRLERTWVAVLPIGVGKFRTAEITGRRAEHYADETLLVAETLGGGYHGFAMIVGEQASHGSYDRFKRVVREDVELILDRLDRGIVEVRDAGDTWMRFFHNQWNDRPGLVRNGESVTWEEQLDVYRPLDGAEGPISLGWKQGTLRVEAGGYRLDETVTPDGKVTTP